MTVYCSNIQTERSFCSRNEFISGNIKLTTLVLKLLWCVLVALKDGTTTVLWDITGCRRNMLPPSSRWKSPQNGNPYLSTHGVTFRKSESEVGHPFVLFAGQSTKLYTLWWSTQGMAENVRLPERKTHDRRTAMNGCWIKNRNKTSEKSVIFIVKPPENPKSH
jgi:hypothetical protein